MRCCVPNCGNVTQKSSKSHGITFHKFPRDTNHRNSWITSLGMTEWDVKNRSVICSEHFEDDAFYETPTGKRKISLSAIPRNNATDLDEPATLKACRICLALNGKMYSILEQPLSLMYNRVTGAEIHIEDKLPQMLCWECVGRLTSSNHFIEKALKTQWILLNKINGSAYITMRDIKSIDKVQNGLKSSLGVKSYKVNESNMHIVEESIVESIVESLTNNDNDDRDSDDNDDFNDYDEIYNANDLNDETDPFRNDQLDANVKDVSNDFSNNDDVLNNEVKDENNDTKVKFEVVVYNESEKDIEEENKVEIELSEVTGVVKQRHKRRTSSPLGFKNKRSKTQQDKKYSTDHLIKQEENSSVEGRNITEDAEDVKPKRKKFKKIVKSEPDTRRVMLKDSKHLKKPFICEICDRPFQQKANLIEHVLKHPKMFTCNYCSYKTCKKDHLRQHVNAKHTKSTSFKCHFCNFATYDKSSLRRHVNSQHTRNTVFECSHCDFKSYGKEHLNEHVNATHTKIITYDCAFCDYQTYRKRDLSQHVHARHAKSKTLRCFFCNFKTFDNVSLNEHVNTKHAKPTEKIALNCIYCDFTTDERKRLTKHVNSKHIIKTDSFSCSYCSFKTTQKSSLSEHINARHTKATTYDCPYCSFKTYYRSALNKHNRMKHAAAS